MGKFDEYLDKAKELAEDAGDKAKIIAGDVVNKAKQFTDEGKVREFTQSAKEQTSVFTLGAKEKVQGVLQDAKAGKEIRQGINELEAMPEIEGSILYTMEHEVMVKYLSSLLLIINDGRLDDGSVVEEIRKVMDKVQPGPVSQEEEASQPVSDEQQAIEKAKTITYNACTKALEIINASA